MKNGLYRTAQRQLRSLIIFTICFLFSSCNEIGSPPLESLPPPAEDPPFSELSEGEFPPCLRYPPYPLEIVIRNHDDYDSLRTRYAPQGTYEDFTANGIQTRFVLSYQPLDWDTDGGIEEDEVIVYVTGSPIFIFYQGESIRVSSNPFHVVGDSLIIYNDSTHIGDRKVPCNLVFSVDSKTGAVNFVRPPPSGNRVSVCGSARLYDVFDGRTCSMWHFDFETSSIIGKRVMSYYPECVTGIDKEIIRNDSLRQITYRYKPIIGLTCGGGDISSFFSWIAVERIPDDYAVIFEEIE